MSFEEEYGKRFAEHQSTDGIDEAGIWAAVEQNLDSTAGKGGGATWAKLGGALGLFLLVAVGYYFTQSSETSSDATYQNQNTVSQNQGKLNTTSISTELDSQKGDATGLTQSSDLSKPSVETQSSLQKINSEGAAQELHSAPSYTGGEQVSAKANKLTLKQADLAGQETQASAQDSDTNDLERTPAQAPQVSPSADADDTKASANNLAQESANTGINSNISVSPTATDYTKAKGEDSAMKSTDSPNENTLKTTQKQDADDIAKAPNDSERATPETMGATLGMPKTVVNSQTNLETISLLGLQASSPVLAIDSDLRDLADADYRAKSNWAPTEVYLLAGVNQINSQYRSFNNEPVLADLRAATQSAFGYGATAGATWVIKSHLRLGVGINYEHYRDRLDWQRVSESTTIVDNSLIGSQIDSLGMMAPVFGSAEYSSTETRTVGHTNHYHAISIPLLVGVEKSWGRTTAGVDLGIAYTRFITQRGRTLNIDDFVVDFDNELDDERTPLQASSITYRLSPFLDYALTDKLALRVNSNMSYLPLQTSKLLGQDRGALLFNAQVGLVIQLD